MLPKTLFTELEIITLDNLFLLLKDETNKLRCKGYDAHTLIPIYFITEEKKSESLLLFFFENKEKIMKGDFAERRIAKSTGEGDYSFESDFINMSSVKISDSEIIVSIDIFNHYYSYDGRNCDKGCKNKSHRFVVPLA